MMDYCPSVEVLMNSVKWRAAQLMQDHVCGPCLFFISLIELHVKLKIFLPTTLIPAVVHGSPFGFSFICIIAFIATNLQLKIGSHQATMILLNIPRAYNVVNSLPLKAFSFTSLY